MHDVFWPSRVALHCSLHYLNRRLINFGDGLDAGVVPSAPEMPKEWSELGASDCRSSLPNRMAFSRRQSGHRPELRAPLAVRGFVEVSRFNASAVSLHSDPAGK